MTKQWPAGETSHSSLALARFAAMHRADANGAPVAILRSPNGWYVISENPPDDIEGDPIARGYVSVQIVDPDDMAVTR